MKILEWNGEIGWDLDLYKVNNDLQMANGDDITARLSSPGGSLDVGGDIYLALINYRNANPKARMILEIGSVAASYASLLAASPVWDLVRVSEISMAMYHNPASIVYGDYRVMRDQAESLEKARDMYVSIYSRRSNQSSQQIKDMMDKTTWFYGGQEIIDAGFADELIKSDDVEKDMNMLKSNALTQFNTMIAKMSSESEKIKPYDKDKIVACMTASKITEHKSPEVTGVNNMEVTVKTKQELQKEKPEIYNETVNDGVMLERDRVKKLSEMKAKDEYKSIPEVVAALDKAILDGNSIDEATTMMNAAMVAVLRNPNMSAQLDSTEDLGSGDQETPVMKTKKKIGEV